MGGSWKEQAHTYIFQDNLISSSQVSALSQSAIESSIKNLNYVNYFSNSINDILNKCDSRYILSILYLVDGIFRILNKKYSSSTTTTTTATIKKNQDSLFNTFNSSFSTMLQNNEKKILEKTPESDCRKLIKLLQIWLSRNDFEDYFLKKWIYRISDDLNINLDNLNENNNNNNNNAITQSKKRELNYEIDDILEPNYKYQKTNTTNTTTTTINTASTTSITPSNRITTNNELINLIYILPTEMIFEILSHLSVLDLLKVSKVCKFFLYFVNSLPSCTNISFENIIVSSLDMQRTLIQFNSIVKINFSFNRIVNNQVITTLANHCPLLENVNISGCLLLDLSSITLLVKNSKNLKILKMSQINCNNITVVVNKPTTTTSTTAPLLQNRRRGKSKKGRYKNNNNDHHGNTTSTTTTTTTTSINLTSSFIDLLFNRNININRNNTTKRSSSKKQMMVINSDDEYFEDYQEEEDDDDESEEEEEEEQEQICKLKKLDISCCHPLIYLLLQYYEQPLSCYLEHLNIDCYCNKIDIGSYAAGLSNAVNNFPFLKKLKALYNPETPSTQQQQQQQFTLHQQYYHPELMNSLPSLNNIPLNRTTNSNNNINNNQIFPIIKVENIWKKIVQNDINGFELQLSSATTTTPAATEATIKKLNKRYLYGTTSIYVACRNGNLRIIDNLMSTGLIDTSIPDYLGLTPLLISNSIFVVNKLVTDYSIEPINEFENLFINVCKILNKYHSFLSPIELSQQQARPDNPQDEEMDQLLNLLLKVPEQILYNEIIRQTNTLLVKFVKNFKFFQDYIKSIQKNLQRSILINQTLRDDLFYSKTDLPKLSKEYEKKILMTLNGI